MEKIKIGDREVALKELKYKDISSLDKDNQAESTKKMIMLSTDLTEEEYNELTIREGLTIQKKINELNGLEDFQQATPQN